MELPEWMKRRSHKAEATLNAYRRLFSTDDGQMVLKDLMKSCFVNRTVIGRDATETYYNEGMRSTVLRIIETANLTSDEIQNLSQSLMKDEKDLFN